MISYKNSKDVNIENIIIETERLIIREFKEDDIGQYFKMISNDNVYKWLGDRKKKSIYDAKRIMLYFKNKFRDEGRGVLAVVSKENGSLIGQVGVNYAPNLGCFEYLYAIAYEEWNKGYATEIGIEFINYYRDRFKDEKIVAVVYPENLSSKKVLSKLNFDFKGQKEMFGGVLDYYELNLG